METLGERLKSARLKAGLKQIQVKERTQINNKTLSGYENGVSEPDLNTLTVLADLYNVSTDYLLGREHMKDVVVIAAHRSDNELDSLPEEAFREIENFKEFIRLKYGNINKKGE